jgi:hypothetical protein
VGVTNFVGRNEMADRNENSTTGLNHTGEKEDTKAAEERG